MENNRTTGIRETIAKITSVIFHPLFMPLYGLLIIFTAPTFFLYIPFKVKKILFLVVATNNILLPVLLLPFFRYRNIISSWIIETRKERIVPLLSVSFFYSITSIILFRLHIPLFLKAYIFSTAIIAIVVTIINFWWKISLHSVGAGALTGIVVVLSLKMMVPLTWFLIPVILIAGLVLSSRLKLNSHNGSQVYLGFLTGFAGMNLIMSFFK
ncbi:MAG: hypothetical protein C0408_06360 [Odoribacter sp.]|nr:hypothetical protein [Odoribacter sp.]